MKMKELVVNGESYQVWDPEAAHIDDSKAGPDTCWSGEQIMRRLCPAFTQSGGVVCCNPAEGSLLNVVSHIQPLQTGSGVPSLDSWVTAPGIAVRFEGNPEQFLSTGDALVHGMRYRLTVNAKDTSGAPIKLSSAEVYDYNGMYGSSLHDVLGDNYVEFTMDCYQGTGSAVDIRLTYDGELDESTVYCENESSGDVELLDGVFTFSLWHPGNVRPIFGHTACQLWRENGDRSDTFVASFNRSAGKNLLPYPYTTGALTQNGLTGGMLSDGGVQFSGTLSGEYYYNLTKDLSLPAGTYTFSLSGNWSGSWGYVLIQCTGLTKTLASGNAITFTLEAPCTDMKIYIYMTDTSCITGTVYPQLEAGSTATAYEPYGSGSSDNTVYGGSFNWQTGVLTIDHKLLTYAVADMNNHEEYPGWLSQDASLYECFGKTNEIKDLTMNIGSECGINSSQTRSIFILPVTSYGLTQSEWKSMFPDLVVQAVAPLQNPITVQLPPQEIVALSGENALYSDTGDTEVTGKADPIAVIENLQKRLAALEAAAVENL